MLLQYFHSIVYYMHVQLSFWKTPLMMAFDNKTNLKQLMENKTITGLDLVGTDRHDYTGPQNIP